MSVSGEDASIEGTSVEGAPAAASAPAPVEVDPRLLAILVCPLTKARLRYDAAAQELVSEAAGLAYPIRGGIPIMLIDEARVMPD